MAIPMIPGKHAHGANVAPLSISNSTSRSTRSSDDTEDHPERLLLARRSEYDARGEETPPRKQASSQTSRSPAIPCSYVPGYDEEISDMASSLDLSAQEPPPDLSSSVMSSWSLVYEECEAQRQQQEALQREHEAANVVLDELDKTFTPTVEKPGDRARKQAARHEDCSHTTPSTPEPEWFAEAWWKENSTDGKRRELPRGGYDSRFTHVVYGSSF